MAVIPYSTEETDGNIRIVTWANIANGDTCQPYVGPHFSDCSAHVYGTFGAGGNLRMQGSNETVAAPTAWVPLSDNIGNVLDFTSNGADVIVEHMYQIRPHPTAGDGTTALTAKVMFTSNAQRWRAPGT